MRNSFIKSLSIHLLKFPKDFDIPEIDQIEILDGNEKVLSDLFQTNIQYRRGFPNFCKCLGINIHRNLIVAHVKRLLRTAVAHIKVSVH